ncbi:TPA: hypothetical protein ACX6R4_000667 [Photobacterium damselae]
MSFSLYLKNKLSNSKMNRSNLIAQLNLYHKEFANLDAITFSRWLNKKTTPSPYKQILISSYFNDDPIVFIKEHISIKKEAKLIENIFDKTMNNIELSYTNISYFHNYSHPNYTVESLDQEQYNSKFKGYYNNFRTYIELSKLLNGSIKDNICIIKRKKDIISSHISLFRVNSKQSNILTNFFNVDISCDYFVNLAYIEDRDSYIFMKSLLLYYFYLNNTKDFICLIRSDFLEFLTALPYEQIGSAYIDGDYKLYLIKADFLNIISNPFIIRFFTNILEKHKNHLDDFFTNEILENRIQS